MVDIGANSLGIPSCLPEPPLFAIGLGKFALIRHQRYAHAKQFKRANRALRTLRTYLGRTIRDITRQIAGEDDLQDIFRKDLHLASRVLEQKQNQRGRKVYSLHAPECVFHAIRPRVPRTSGQSFHQHPATRSMSIRPPGKPACGASCHR
jgi:hypothetical protein